MECNVNNLRKQLVYAFDKLTYHIDNNISKDAFSNNMIRIDEKFVDLHEQVKQYIGFVLCLYDPNDPLFADLSEMDIRSLKMAEELEG